jgi:hypothetical protein
MAAHITKKEAKAFRERWRRVNALELEELRSTDPETRLRQFNTLLGWAVALGWTNDPQGVEEVRRRWARLRKEVRG